MSEEQNPPQQPQQRTFVLYRASGAIQQVCHGSDAPIPPAGLDVLALDGIVDVMGKRVEGGTLVDGALDDRTLPQLKAAKNAEINAARLLANRSGFTFAGKLIASDELSRSDIDAVQAVVARTGARPAGFPGGWKAVDNTMIQIADVATWDAFYSAMYQAGLSNFARSQALKAQLEAATTAEAVAAIAW